ncbi:RHS domain-containing protein [Pandoraea sp.]|uniref:RHS domain-containing protein n=1 Tax=Pandoraea sp. TaxID=1883445 RepID=UPI0035B34204
MQSRSHSITRAHASLYLHKPGTFVPLARIDERLIEPGFLATGKDGNPVWVRSKTKHTTLFYLNDHLGTPQEVVDNTGKVVWLGRYRAWGKTKSVWGQDDPAEFANPIRFQEQYCDDGNAPVFHGREK